MALREGQQATGAEIRAYCREKLVAYKVPSRVEFRDSLPKSAMGKILRRELAREERAAGGAPALSQPLAEAESRPRVAVGAAAPALVTR